MFACGAVLDPEAVPARDPAAAHGRDLHRRRAAARLRRPDRAPRARLPACATSTSTRRGSRSTAGWRARRSTGPARRCSSASAPTSSPLLLISAGALLLTGTSIADLHERNRQGDHQGAGHERRDGAHRRPDRVAQGRGDGRHGDPGGAHRRDERVPARRTWSRRFGWSSSTRTPSPRSPSPRRRPANSRRCEILDGDDTDEEPEAVEAEAGRARFRRRSERQAARRRPPAPRWARSAARRCPTRSTTSRRRRTCWRRARPTRGPTRATTRR